MYRIEINWYGRWVVVADGYRSAAEAQQKCAGWRVEHDCWHRDVCRVTEYQPHGSTQGVALTGE